MASTVSGTATVARDVDARGFVYALEPVHQRQQWRLDKAMTVLAQAQKQLAETEARLTQLLATHDEQAHQLGQALMQRLDPAAHRRHLGYLTSLRKQWLELDQTRQEQRTNCEQCRQQCLREQVRLEGLTQHKEDALAQYGDEMRQRNLNEQDRDWLARSASARTSFDVPKQHP
ncbi:hypothetical protein D3H34_15225 [Acidovorax cavernicola]|uniref:Flagellar FliJ protein n=2 Tax=Acidovorax cavernicola TaxID=1675792 RepID=A0A9X8D487_9BURK|nr:hypothetical protein D3H34_15225 [Acidovorax cavernicola]